VSAPESPTPVRAGKFGDLGQRVLSAIVMIAAAVIALFLGGPAFVLFWGAAGVAVNWEWQRLVGGPDTTARFVVGGIATVAAALAGSLSAAGAMGGALLAGAGFAAWRAGEGRALWAAGGVVYAGAMAAAVCALRASSENGALAIAVLFAIVWGTDVFAYFGGRFVGGPKLWPAVSAGKTWSGTIIGALSGAALGVVVARAATGEALAMAPTFGVAFCISAVSQLGDLFESAIKRKFGVKDSSNLIPGHGGVMDRLDGFTFAVIFAAILGVLRGGGQVAAGLFFWY
jgi:phosphatidate cytidylyltransferase